MKIEAVMLWANNNQGVLAIIIFLISLLIAWFSGLFRWFFRKDNRATAPYIRAGGDIKAGGDITVGNKTFIQKSGKNSTNIQGKNITLNKHGK